MRMRAANWAALAGGGLVAAAVLLIRSEPAYPPPPPLRSFAGLPISGSLADSTRAGFGRCLKSSVELRCRRSNVRLFGQGPFEAAIDLRGSDGRGGFDHLILWVRDDQRAVLSVGKALEARGWRACLKGRGRQGDQMIHTRPGAPALVSTDLSYWSKRRLRIFPAGAPNAPACGLTDQF